MRATHRYSLLRAASVQSHVQFRGDSGALTFQLSLCIRGSAERLFVGVARETKRSYIRYSLHSLTVALGDYIHYFRNKLTCVCATVVTTIKNAESLVSATPGSLLLQWKWC